MQQRIFHTERNYPQIKESKVIKITHLDGESSEAACCDNAIGHHLPSFPKHRQQTRVGTEKKAQ